MKIAPAKLESYLKNPEKDHRAFVVFGPDQGMVSERARNLVALLSSRSGGEVEVKDLKAEDLRSDPALLTDEATSVSMFASAGVIRIRAAGDRVSAALESYLARAKADPTAIDPVVIEAGDLMPSSSLRKLAEKAPQAGAIACYPDTARSLAAYVEDTLSAAKLRIERPAMDLLMMLLGDDRGQTRSELDKLILYKQSDPASDSAGTVTEADIEAVIDVSPVLTADRFMAAILRHDLKEIDRLFISGEGQGLAPTSLLGQVTRNFIDLHKLQIAMGQGRSFDDACKEIRLNPYHPRAKTFKGAIRSWPKETLETAIERTLQIDMMLRSGQGLERPILSRAFMAMARPRSRSA